MDRPKCTKTDHVFKVIVIGDLPSGKNEIIQNFIGPAKSQENFCAAGFNCTTKTVLQDGKQIKLQLMDTLGMEKFRTLTRNFFKGAHAAILVFDPTQESSVQLLLDLYPCIMENMSIDSLKVLVKNTKSTLPDCPLYQEATDSISLFNLLQ